MHACHTDKKAWQDTHAVLEYIIIRFPLNRKNDNKKMPANTAVKLYLSAFNLDP